MECSGCFGTNLIHNNGRLVCEDCGEEIIGFQEEEEDEVFVGTGVMNRQSQSSHALTIRETLQARRESRQYEDTTKRPTVIPEQLIYEGGFFMLKAMTDKLISLKYVTSRIRHPLFQIMSHWIRRKHAGRPFHSYTTLKPRVHYLLAMLALAAAFIRSPLLPRDLCRLAITRQIPYLTALITETPERIATNRHVQKVLATDTVPTVRRVIRAANGLALGSYAWSPLRDMYGNLGQRTFTTQGDKVSSIPESFPVGHGSITLLRLIRLLGLPDDFGARVLRWRELRARATHETANNTANCLYQLRRPTEDTIIVDVINTMRLCYGRRLCYGGTVLTKREANLEDEWKRCKQTMAQWIKIGNAEDVDKDLWSCLPIDALRSISGKRLEKHANLIDTMLTQSGDTEPDLWGPFLQEFKDVAGTDLLLEEEDKDEGNLREKMDNEETEKLLRTETECMYDVSRYGCNGANNMPPVEGIEEMEHECGYDEETEELIVRGFLIRSSTRSQQFKPKRTRSRNKASQADETSSGQEWRSCIDSSDENNDEAVDASETERESQNEQPRSERGVGRRLSAHQFNWVWEPAGIGLAWTIMICFFDGSDKDIIQASHEQNRQFSNRMRAMIAMCNRSMKTVMEYLW